MYRHVFGLESYALVQVASVVVFAVLAGNAIAVRVAPGIHRQLLLLQIGALPAVETGRLLDQPAKTLRLGRVAPDIEPVQIERRFQGIEAPHKMKLAAAGCPRNCSEAYVKDLGAVAIEGGLWGGFGTTGQRCTATSRIIVQKGVYREFVDRYVARAKKLKIGNGLDETVDVGPAINEAQLKTDLSYVDIGRDEGAKLACGGNRLDKGDYQYGFFMEPTVFIDVDSKMHIAQEEIFGPVVSILPCDGLEDAIEIANGVEYGLS